MITTAEVMEWVRSATKTDLDLVSELMKIRRSVMARDFKPGDPVKFDGGRNRGIIHGKFVKLMQKNAEVLANTGGRWRVNPALLEKDETPQPQYQIKITPANAAARAAAHATTTVVPPALPGDVQDAEFEEFDSEEQ